MSAINHQSSSTVDKQLVNNSNDLTESCSIKSNDHQRSSSNLTSQSNSLTKPIQPKCERMDVDASPLHTDHNEQIQITRVLLNETTMIEMSKDELVKKWKQQNDYIDTLEDKLKIEISNREACQDNERKIKRQLFDLTRKENLLVMKLTTKEHEIQEYVKQIQELKLSQIASNDRLQNTLLDPAVNMIFEEMRKEIEKSNLKVEEIQNELSAWKFTPDSNTGKRLMAKCRLLYQENEELGKVISSGRIAKLEGELALQKSFSEEMKKSQGELDEFLFELDEDVEGLQSTIYHLQQQLKEAKDSLQKYQLKEENQAKHSEVIATEKVQVVADCVERELEEKKVTIEPNNQIDQSIDETMNKQFSPNRTTTEVELENVDHNKTIESSDIDESESSVKQSSTNEISETITYPKNGDDQMSNKPNQQINDTSPERKRSLDEALEEVNLMSDNCGIDFIIRKHRKVEQEKGENLLKNNN